MITLPKIPENLREYFINHKIDDVFKEIDTPALSTNELISDIPYRPELDDLYRLHKIVIETRRTTILEFGCGWSTYVLASALNKNKSTFSNEVAALRRNNPFQIHSVDNEPKFISIAKSRIPSHLDNVFFYETEVRMTTFNGRVATEYCNVPLISPDFIYLDAPDQFNVVGDICGFSTRHKDMMPMSCDILKIEHFLTPGTIIMVDGRTANARFIKANLQRNWAYLHDSESDQHIFQLEESPLGTINQKQLDFYGFDTCTIT